MVHLLIVVFMQYGLSVEAVSARVSGPYTKAACEHLRLRESKPLPLQQGDDARWQFATCIEIQSISEPQPITEKWTY